MNLHTVLWSNFKEMAAFMLRSIFRFILGFAFWLAIGYFTDPGWFALVFLIFLLSLLEIWYKSYVEKIAAQQQKIESLQKTLDSVYEKLAYRITYLEDHCTFRR